MLVLSRFAGAAQELKDALIVNPYDTDQVAAALQMALAMPLEERVTRWSGMMNVLTRNTISVWRDRFLTALDHLPPGHRPSDRQPGGRHPGRRLEFA